MLGVKRLGVPQEGEGKVSIKTTTGFYKENVFCTWLIYFYCFLITHLICSIWQLFTTNLKREREKNTDCNKINFVCIKILQ